MIIHVRKVSVSRSKSVRLTFEKCPSHVRKVSLPRTLFEREFYILKWIKTLLLLVKTKIIIILK